jgi:hypothetical protein
MFCLENFEKRNAGPGDTFCSVFFGPDFRSACLKHMYGFPIQKNVRSDPAALASV